MKLHKSVTFALATAMGLQASVNLLAPTSGSSASLSFDLPEYSIDTISVNGTSYSKISSADLEAISEVKGAPELPYSSVAIQLRGSGAATLKIESIEYKEIQILPPVPSKGSLTRNIDPSTVIAEEGEQYRSASFLPATSVVLDNPYQIRDVRGVAARIHPFSYNSETGTLRVAEKINFSVVEENTTAPRTAGNKQSAEFSSVLENRFINSNSSVMTRYASVEDGDKMIIITASKFKAEAEKLALWKNKKGISTKVFSYPSETGNGVSGIQSFIQDQYDNNGITYVTLVGDLEDIPSKVRDYNNGGPGASDDNDVSSDPTYTYLSGNDIYPDVFIGRISARTAQEADGIVNKIITYEKEPEVGATWYNKAVSVGSNEGTPKDYDWLKDSINTVLKGSYYDKVDQISQGITGTTSDLSKYINEGRGLVNFMGHGNNDGFGFSGGWWYKKSMVTNLRNENRLPVVIPLACQFGTFKKDNVVAEEWLRNPNGGAIAIMGSTPLMDWTPPQYAQVEMNRLIARDAHSSMGAYFYNGEMKMLDVSYSGDKTMHTWTYFGDPSLQFMSSSPEQLSLTIDGDLAVGQNSLTVSGDDGVLVTLYSKDLEIFESKEIRSGSATFNVDAKDVGTLFVTGTKRNSAPAIDSLVISDVAEENVAPTDITISNDTIMAGLPSRTLIGTFAAVDANTRDTHTFEQVTGQMTGLEVIGDSLFAMGMFEEGTIDIEVRATDKEGLSVTKEFTVTVIPNRFLCLVNESAWSAGSDSLGSKATINVDSMKSEITAEITRDVNPKYTKWANITGQFDGDLLAGCEFYITYSATDSMKLVFPMKELQENGEGHYLTLPSTNGETSTVMFTTNDLVQPSWVKASRAETTFDRTEVNMVLIELASQDEAKAKGSITISGFGIDGYGQPVGLLTGNALNAPTGIELHSINSSAMNLGVPTDAAYRVEMFTANGRRIHSADLNLTAGFHSIPLTSSLGTGLVIMRVSNANVNFTTRAILK